MLFQLLSLGRTELFICFVVQIPDGLRRYVTTQCKTSELRPSPQSR